jgi:glucuronate isomerase
MDAELQIMALKQHMQKIIPPKKSRKFFKKLFYRNELNEEEILKFKSAMMFEFGVMDYEKNWVQQLHLGALRNVNAKMYNVFGT